MRRSAIALKHTACLAVILCAFPLAALLTASFTGIFSAPLALLPLLFLLISFYLGYGLEAFVSHRAGIPSAVAGVLRLLFMALPAGAALFPWPNLSVRIFVGVLSVFYAAVGRVCFSQPYDRTLRPGLYGTFLAADCIAALFLLYTGRTPEISWFVGCFLVVTAIFLVVRNRAAQDHLMARRRHRDSALPAHIRGYNLLLLGAFFALLLLGYLFRGAILTGLGSVWWAVSQVFLGVFRFLNAIIQFLFSGGEGEEDSASAPTGDQGFGAGAEDGSSSYLWLYVLVAAAVLWLLVRYRREILAVLRRGLRRLFSVLLRLFTLRRKERGPDAEEEFFTDFEETLVPAERKTGADERRSRRQRRRELRAYRRMEAGPERFRSGYRLVLLWLDSRPDPPPPSYTPSEILDKFGAALPRELTPVTHGYNRLRYGATAPTGTEYGLMDALLNELYDGKR